MSYVWTRKPTTYCHANQQPTVLWQLPVDNDRLLGHGIPRIVRGGGDGVGALLVFAVVQQPPSLTDMDPHNGRDDYEACPDNVLNKRYRFPTLLLLRCRSPLSLPTSRYFNTN